MKRLPGRLLATRRPLAALKAIWLLALRSIRAIDHRRMKWHLTALGRRYLSDKEWKDFASLLAQYIYPKVSDFIERKRREGASIFIASAAPEEYTNPLAEQLGLDGALATPFTSRIEDYTELRGDRKLAVINRLLADRRLRLDTFLTDHPDDLPTASAYPRQTIIVNPDAHTARIFRLHSVNRHLWC